MSQVYHANCQVLTSCMEQNPPDKLMVCQPKHFKEPGKSLYSETSPVNPNPRSENSAQTIMILIFKIYFNIIFLSKP